MKFSMTIKRFAVAALCLLVLDLAECSRQAKVQKARERTYELDGKSNEEAPVVPDEIAGPESRTPYCCSKYMDLADAVAGTCTTETTPPNGCSLLNAGVTKFRANYMLAPFTDPPAELSFDEYSPLSDDAREQYLSVQLSSAVGAGGPVFPMGTRACVPLSCDCCHTMTVKFFELAPVTEAGADFQTLSGADLSLCCDTDLAVYYSTVFGPNGPGMNGGSQWLYTPRTYDQCELVRGSGEVIRPVLTIHFGGDGPFEIPNDDIIRLYAARVYCEKSVCPGN
eukprot:321739_1